MCINVLCIQAIELFECNDQRHLQVFSEASYREEKTYSCLINVFDQSAIVWFLSS